LNLSEAITLRAQAQRVSISRLRSRRERALQTLCFEALGLTLVSPLFAWFADASSGDSLRVLAALSVAVMCWSALYNTLFDLADLLCTGRVASERPRGLRLVHAIGLETTATLVTWPLLVWLTPLGWLDALAAELGLTAAYAAYGYCFHLGFDHLRPVRAGAGSD
jgi:uncharacterized membrane protein